MRALRAPLARARRAARDRGRKSYRALVLNDSGAVLGNEAVRRLVELKLVRTGGAD